MSRIAVIGGTGYAGSHIVREARDRGHEVSVISRSSAAEPVNGVHYLTGSLFDTPALVDALGEVDVVIVSVPGRGDLVGQVRPATAELLKALPAAVRVGVVGGAGGSLVAPDGPRVVDTAEFPAEVRPEALEAIGVLDDLRADASGHSWFYIHPAGGFGSWAPGERTGTYRDGGHLLVVDDKGESFISGPDFGVAVLDEVENPKHTGDNFTVGY